MTSNDSWRAPLLTAAAAVAAAAPSLLAWNVSPSPTFLNQALAFGVWGAWLMVVGSAQASRPGFAASRMAWPVQAALALLLLAAGASSLLGAWPPSLALSALVTLAAAMLLVHAGAQAGADAAEGVAVYAAFSWGWLAAALVNLVIALVQVFEPGWPDGSWVAVSNIAGRAVGNLRQPNHLSSVLLWGVIAAVALVELRRLQHAAAAMAMAALVFGVVLTASRTGLVSVGLLAVWALVDRRLATPTRVLLGATPVVYAASWLAMVRWAEWAGHTFGGAARLAETDVSGSRFGIWSNTLELIRQQPWTGVGFGEFNLAWTLTPFPKRPPAFFDHAHNLPLQFAVELGLPLAALVLALLVGGLWLAARRAWQAEGDASTVRRAALVFVLMIGVHSLVEYPLWYAYFLLPAAWAFGFACARAGAPAPRAAGWPMLAPAGVTMCLVAAFSVWDYAQVARIFSARATDAPLEVRIAQGQRSWFSAHHADYAAATTDVDPALQRDAFAGATHYLLDTRLMMAWAEALAARGEVDRARHLAARLREFRNPASKEWFAVCDEPPRIEPLPFQCTPPERAHAWREFIRLR